MSRDGRTNNEKTKCDLCLYNWFHASFNTCYETGAVCIARRSVFLGSQASSHHKGLNDSSHYVPRFTSLFPPHGIKWFLTWCSWVHKPLYTTRDWMIPRIMFMGSQDSLRHKRLNDSSHDVPGFTSLFTPQGIESFLTWVCCEGQLNLNQAKHYVRFSFIRERFGAPVETLTSGNPRPLLNWMG